MRLYGDVGSWPNLACGSSGPDCSCRHILQDNRVSADDCAIADRDAGEQSSSVANPDRSPYRYWPLAVDGSRIWRLLSEQVGCASVRVVCDQHSAPYKHFVANSNRIRTPNMYTVGKVDIISNYQTTIFANTFEPKRMPRAEVLSDNNILRPHNFDTSPIDRNTRADHRGSNFIKKSIFYGGKNCAQL